MYSARAPRNTQCRRRRATLPTKPTPIEGGMAWVEGGSFLVKLEWCSGRRFIV